MTKTGLKIKWEIEVNYAIVVNQTVTNIHVDDDGFAFGLWKGHLVGAFHVDSLVWHVL